MRNVRMTIWVLAILSLIVCGNVLAVDYTFGQYALDEGLTGGGGDRVQRRSLWLFDMIRLRRCLLSLGALLWLRQTLLRFGPTKGKLSDVGLGVV